MTSNSVASKDKTTTIDLMAHLMRRAGFGADRDELERRVAKGYEATVILADTQRQRVQIYNKLKDYTPPSRTL